MFPVVLGELGSALQRRGDLSMLANVGLYLHNVRVCGYHLYSVKHPCSRFEAMRVARAH